VSSGRTAVVTGATSGIGAAAALELDRQGFSVIGVGRDEERLAKLPAGLAADLSSQGEVHRLAHQLLERLPRIDVLVNNAGVVMSRRRLTVDGREMTMAVNHLAPFLLTRLLVGRLRASAPARVITTSSDAHYRGRLDPDDLDLKRGWTSWGAYCASKLANVLFTRSLAARLEGTGVVAHCLHPGVIRTRLFRDTRAPVRAGVRAASLLLAAPDTGAETLVHLAAADEPAGLTGLYWSRRRVSRPSDAALDDRLAGRLWERSEQLTGEA
jgi:retinol dehydrogenase-12